MDELASQMNNLLESDRAAWIALRADYDHVEGFMPLIEQAVANHAPQDVPQARQLLPHAKNVKRQRVRVELSPQASPEAEAEPASPTYSPERSPDPESPLYSPQASPEAEVYPASPSHDSASPTYSPERSP